MSLVTLGLNTTFYGTGTAGAVTSTSPRGYQPIEATRANFANILDNLAYVKHARVTLTDAQVKALPTTPITLVSAPGAGHRIELLQAMLRPSFAAGAYTNINASGLLALYTNVVSSGYIGNDAAALYGDGSTPLALLTAFLSANARHFVLGPYMDTITTGFWGVVPSYQATADLDNQPLTISADNNGSGNFTGGNAANTLPIDVLYVEI